MCFGEKGIVGIYLVFRKEVAFSSLPIIHKKKYYVRYYDILHPVARIL